MAASRLLPSPAPRSRSAKRISRAQLHHNLQLLVAAVSAPLLPPTLQPPPSTSSRSATPQPPPPSAKRKLPQDASPLAEQPKRARTSLQHSDVHQPDLSRQAASSSQGAPSADDPSPPPPLPPLASGGSAAALSVLATAPTPGGPEPASFPHRRGKPSAADFTRFHERYSQHGKFFKYSAEIRGQVAGGAQDHSSAHRKLNPAPPPPGSPYAVHAQLFARIEAVDALLNFTYAMWCKDMVENKCHHALWDTIDQFLKWVRSRWETAETRGDAQRAFIGVIRMVEAYIYARKAAFMNIANAKRFSELEKVVKAPQPANDATTTSSPATSLGGSSQHSMPTASPPAVAYPSPAATGTTQSRQPTTATSATLTSSSASSSSGPSAAPSAMAPTPRPHAAPGIHIPRDMYESLQASHNCNTRSARAMSAAALYLNLGTLARHFPRTSARVLAAQLRPDEEYEVDFEQDACSRGEGASGAGLGGEPLPGPGEGQLVWPGALNALGGEGVAWVCLLGRAMIRELAYPLGYRGQEGILLKDVPPPR